MLGAGLGMSDENRRSFLRASGFLPDQEAEAHPSTSTLRVQGDWGAALGRSFPRLTRRSREGHHPVCDLRRATWVGAAPRLGSFPPVLTRPCPSTDPTWGPVAL